MIHTASSPSASSHHPPFASSPLARSCLARPPSSPISFLASDHDTDTDTLDTLPHSSAHAPLLDVGLPDDDDDNDDDDNDNDNDNDDARPGPPPFLNLPRPPSQRVAVFGPRQGSCSPGPSWLPALDRPLPSSSPRSVLRNPHHRFNNYKQPLRPPHRLPSLSLRATTPSASDGHSSASTLPSSPSPRHPPQTDLSLVTSPLTSSPTPHHAHPVRPSGSIHSAAATGSRARQEIANRLRSLDRAQRLRSRRPLLDRFLPGTPRGTDDANSSILNSAQEESLINMLSRRELCQFEMYCRQNLPTSSADSQPDEEALLEIEEEVMVPPQEFETELDPAKMYEAYAQDLITLTPDLPITTTAAANEDIEMDNT